ncbi:NAD(P)-binding protein [Armillaria gallica]|uniref:NAD(P)-binding protein n=1 Tax=Armillaria gallica TaxID=47427 RepID=A0A2H3E5L6_ARMGA|nr:NAD(P)-binding protein [Armillaria gallica]
MSTPGELPSIFFLGCTGFLGGHLLKSLARDLPAYNVIALLRDLSANRKASVSELHPNVTFIDGTLDDDAIIEEWSSKCPIVINTASSDHWPSVRSTLAGLEKNSARHPGKPPIYLHISGLEILSDNCRGESVDPANIRWWTDSSLNLRDCDPSNMHLESDIPIVDAGTRTQNPVRTMIMFPGWIYGLGEGVQKTTTPVRYFRDTYTRIGRAGTWGPGANVMPNVHVKDCASACLTVLKAAIDGKAQEGAEGLYFVASDQPMVPMHEWASAVGDWMFDKGLVTVGGFKPLPAEIVDPLGHYGWSLFGGSQYAKVKRLYTFGWEPLESRKLSLMESLPTELEVAFA